MSLAALLFRRAGQRFSAIKKTKAPDGLVRISVPAVLSFQNPGALKKWREGSGADEI
jgi:hypothetical protein